MPGSVFEGGKLIFRTLQPETIAKYRGEIGFGSEAGKGSTFWFTAQMEKQTNWAKTQHGSAEAYKNQRVRKVLFSNSRPSYSTIRN